MRRMKSSDKIQVAGNVRAALMLKEASRRVEAGADIELPQPASLRCLVFTVINCSDGDGAFWHGLRTLASWSDLPDRTAQRCLSLLVALGVIEVEHRVRSRGHARRDCKSVHRINWDELQRYTVTDETGATVARVRGRESEAPLFENRRHGGACSDANTRHQVAEHAPPDPRTRASAHRSTHDDDETCGTDPVLNRLENQPPLPPQRPSAPDRGGGAVAQARSDRADAEAIVDAYPPTPGDLRDDDVDAAMRAIQRERDAGTGITAALILEVAKRLARMPPKSPVWCRTWCDRGGYAKAARALIQRPVHAPQADVNAARRAEDERARQSIEAEQRAIAEALDGLSADELQALKQRVVDAEPLAFIRAQLRRADPKSSAMLRSAMAAQLRSVA